MVKKSVINSFILFLGIGWEILFYSIYRFYSTHYKMALAYRHFPQSSGAFNYFYPFLLTPIFTLIFSPILSLLFYFILYGSVNIVKNIINHFKRGKKLEIQQKCQNLEVEKISFYTFFRPAFISSLFFFNVIINFANFIDSEYLIYQENIVGDEISFIIMRFMALLPITLPFFSGFIGGISILGWRESYYSVYINNELRKMDSLDNFYFSIFKGYIGISSIVNILLFGYRYYQEFNIYYPEFPFFYMLLFPVFIFIGIPIAQLPTYLAIFYLTKWRIKKKNKKVM